MAVIGELKLLSIYSPDTMRLMKPVPAKPNGCEQIPGKHDSILDLLSGINIASTGNYASVFRYKMVSRKW
jgi:hypothetical protein